MMFKYQYAFLSNFHPVDISFDGMIFPSVENAFQAAKTVDYQKRVDFRFISPKDAKAKGKTLKLREDWDQVKLSLMQQLVEQKFSNPKLREKLINVSENIVEENYWHDNFWGKCLCDKCLKKTKNNHLGNILETVKQNIIRVH